MNKKIWILSLVAPMAMAVQAQQIKAKSDVIDCGQVVFRQPVTVEFELTSSGSPVVINSVKPSCGCTRVSYPPAAIGREKPVKLTATYDAKQMGHFDKVIDVYAEGQTEPLELHLKGVVVDEVRNFAGSYEFALGRLKADKNNVEFDDVSRGEMPVQEIHIENTTTDSATPVVMHLPSWLKAEVSPSTIAPGHSGVARLTLDSRNLHAFGLTQSSVFLGMFPGDKVSPEKEISVSAVLLPNFEDMTDEQLTRAPQLRLSTSELDLGAFDGKKKKTGTIIIENVGRSTLDISSLQMFTAGLKIALSKSRLEPGEEAKLKITADQKQLKTARSKPRVLMITNDPDHSKVIININVK